MIDPVMSMMRAKKLRISVDRAVAMARAGKRVVWVHPTCTPPPPWVEKELREAGVNLMPIDGKAQWTNASRIDLGSP